MSYKNPLDKKEYNRKYSLLNKEKINKIQKKCRDKNKSKYKERYKNKKIQYFKKAKENVTDIYVKIYIYHCFYRRGIKLKFSDISQELVELTRKKIQIKRLLKNKQNGKN